MQWEYKSVESETQWAPPSSTTRKRLVDKVEKVGAPPLMLLAIAWAFIILWAAIRPSNRLREADWEIWSIFAFDYFVRLVISPGRRRRFFPLPWKENEKGWLDGILRWFDSVVVVFPLVWFAHFASNPFRVLRGLLRAGASGMKGYGEEKEGTKTSEEEMDGTQVQQKERGTRSDRHWSATLGLGVVVALIGLSAFVRYNENAFSSPQPGVTPNPARISSIFDGIWWEVSTVTTVGYGDRVPVTPEGRGIGIFLMLVGIGLFVTLTGALASWLLGTASTSATELVYENKRRPLDLALNDLAKDRWELIGIHSIRGRTTFVFKRLML